MQDSLVVDAAMPISKEVVLVSDTTLSNLYVRASLIALVLNISQVFPVAQADQPAIGDAQDVKVPEAYDLKALGEQSRQSGLPIILVFSDDNCSYCERLEEDVLRPMIFTGELKNHALLRKYKIDRLVTIRDFDGQSRDAERLSTSRHVDVTPTVQIVDACGREIVPAIVGYQTPDFYPAYLMKAIEVSQQILRECK